MALCSCLKGRLSSLSALGLWPPERLGPPGHTSTPPDCLPQGPALHSPSQDLWPRVPGVAGPVWSLLLSCDGNGAPSSSLGNHHISGLTPGDHLLHHRGRHTTKGTGPAVSPKLLQPRGQVEQGLGSGAEGGAEREGRAGAQCVAVQSQDGHHDGQHHGHEHGAAPVAPAQGAARGAPGLPAAVPPSRRGAAQHHRTFWQG